MSMPSSDHKSPSRGKILRDLLSFQAKLWVEGFKDVVLVPLSLGAAVLDLLFGKNVLYGVMKTGDRFEQWINLYGALDQPEVQSEEKEEPALAHTPPSENTPAALVRRDAQKMTPTRSGISTSVESEPT